MYCSDSVILHVSVRYQKVARSAGIQRTSAGLGFPHPSTSAEANRSVYLWFWERYIYEQPTSTTLAFLLARKLYLSPSSHHLPSNERTSKHILLSTISSLALILDMLRATRHRQDKRPIDRMSESEVKSKLLLSDKTIAELDHA